MPDQSILLLRRIALFIFTPALIIFLTSASISLYIFYGVPPPFLWIAGVIGLLFFFDQFPPECPRCAQDRWNYHESTQVP